MPLYGYVIKGTENERIEGLAPGADALKKEIIKTVNQTFQSTAAASRQYNQSPDDRWLRDHFNHRLIKD